MSIAHRDAVFQNGGLPQILSRVLGFLATAKLVSQCDASFNHDAEIFIARVDGAYHGRACFQ